MIGLDFFHGLKFYENNEKLENTIKAIVNSCMAPMYSICFVS